MKNRMSKLTSLSLAVILLLMLLAAPSLAAYENTYINGSDAAQNMIGVASTQVGFAENSDGSTKYGLAFGNSYMDWSCAFIAWCGSQAGIFRTVIPAYTAISSVYDFYASEKLFTCSAATGSSYVPHAGDIAFFSSKANSLSDMKSIGLVSSVSGRTAYIIEGDKSGKVTKTAYSADDAYICGFATPDYDKSYTYVTGNYTVGTTMNFRSSPSITAQIIGSVPVDTVVNVTQISGVWGKITYSGQTGWISLEYSSYNTVAEKEVDWLVVDMSYSQPDERINWTALKNSGVKAVILRIGGRGYGSSKAIYADSEFYAHYKSAKAAGLHVGAYFFSYALTAAQAKEEAQYVINTLSSYKCELDMPVYIDIEDYDGDTARQHYNAGKAVCSMVCENFCAEIEAAGLYAGIYCNLDFAKNLIAASVFNNRSTWIAHWASSCGYTGTYEMWQYTQTGRLNGYNGNLDLSRCYVNYPAKIANGETKGDKPFEGHNPSAWQTTLENTCTQDGGKAIICTDANCSLVLRTQLIPAKGHTSSAECAVLGKTDLTVGAMLDTPLTNLYNSADHEDYSTFISETLSSEGGTTLTYCTVCREILTAQYHYTGSCAHSSVHTTNKAATCSAEGYSSKTCTECEKLVSASIAAKTAHTPTGEIEQQATCAVQGNKSIKCSVCSTTLSYQLTGIVPHSFSDWYFTEAPTFVSGGQQQRSCSVCGLAETQTVTKLVLGDSDGDNNVSSADARLTLRNAVGLETFSERQKLSCDIDNDLKITSADARLVLRLAVHLEDSAALISKYHS